MTRLSTRALATILLFLGLGLGALTAGGVFFTTRQAGALREQALMTPIVVASHAIAAHSQIQPGDVEVRQEHTTDAPPQSLRAVADVVGKVALADLYAGAPVLQPQIAAPDKARSLGFTLPQGMDAMELPTPDLVSGAGAIAPGDRIDVILTYPQAAEGKAKATQFALQGVQVIGVGQVIPPADSSGKSNGQAPAPQGTLTLLVTPQQALLLTYAKDGAAEGVSINLVLRRPDDGATHPATPVDLNSLRQALGATH